MDQFTLELNILDRNILEDAAKSKGFDSARSMINDMLKTFPAPFKGKDICSGKRQKCRNLYDIPPEHMEFYKKLACRHSTTVSGIISRYMVFPIIIEQYILSVISDERGLIL
jgi:hypothetical protein